MRTVRDDKDHATASLPGVTSPTQSRPARQTTTTRSTTTTTTTTTTAPSAAASDTLRTYLTAIQEGRFTDAYVHLCAAAQQAVSLEAFTDELNNERQRLPIQSIDVGPVISETNLQVIVNAEIGFGAGTVHPSSPIAGQMIRVDASSPWTLCSVNGGASETLTWPAVLDPDGVR